MNIYTIESKAGLIIGEYSGDTKEQALVKMHKDAGYKLSLDEYGNITFPDEETKDICGDVNDWYINEKN